MGPAALVPDSINPRLFEWKRHERVLWELQLRSRCNRAIPQMDPDDGAAEAVHVGRESMLARHSPPINRYVFLQTVVEAFPHTRDCCAALAQDQRTHAHSHTTNVGDETDTQLTDAELAKLSIQP